MKSVQNWESGGGRNLIPIVLGVVLIISAASKAIHPAETLDVLGQVWQFGSGFSRIVLYVLLMVETLLALSLVVYGRPLDLILAVGFILTVSVSLVRQMIVGSTIGCGCGLSWAGSQALPLALVRNGALIAIALYGVIRIRRDFKDFVLRP